MYLADMFSLLLRMPLKLHQALKRWALDERRTVTAQILHLLEKAVNDRKF